MERVSHGSWSSVAEMDEEHRAQRRRCKTGGDFGRQRPPRKLWKPDEGEPPHRAKQYGCSYFLEANQNCMSGITWGYFSKTISLKHVPLLAITMLFSAQQEAL